MLEGDGSWIQPLFDWRSQGQKLFQLVRRAAVTVEVSQAGQRLFGVVHTVSWDMAREELEKLFVELVASHQF